MHSWVLCVYYIWYWAPSSAHFPRLASGINLSFMPNIKAWALIPEAQVKKGGATRHLALNWFNWFKRSRISQISESARMSKSQLRFDVWRECAVGQKVSATLSEIPALYSFSVANHCRLLVVFFNCMQVLVVLLPPDAKPCVVHSGEVEHCLVNGVQHGVFTKRVLTLDIVFILPLFT